MRTLSAFQLLPQHVVKMIVDHVASNSRRGFVDSHYSPYNFRAFVHARFCDKYELDIDEHGDKVVAKRSSWPDSDRELGYPTHHLASKLDISLHLQSIFTGEALQLLSSAPYDGCAFPLVRALSIDINIVILGEANLDGSDDSLTGERNVYCPDIAANITAFVSRLKEMAPASGKLNTTHTGSVGGLLEHRNANFMDLAQRLFSFDEKRAETAYYKDSLDCYVDLRPISDLAHIGYSIESESDAVIPLIRRSAQTLRTLGVCAFNVPDISGLIRDPDGGGHVEYPRLNRLTTCVIFDSAASQDLVFNGAVPFPRLRRLCIVGDYPFADDVLFRGNNSSLVSFSVVLQPATVAMLKRYNVFTPTSHPELQYINISSPLRHPSSPFTTAAAYVGFGLSIAPKASVRVVSGLAEIRSTISLALSLFGNHASIQVLDFFVVRMSFWDAFDLIKSLPLLSDLYASAPAIAEPSHGVTAADLPDHVRLTYAPMNQRFRCWHFRLSSPTNYAELATHMLLLALACPNFDYVAMEVHSREPFMKAMREKIAEPGFSDYAPRLQRLLFDE
ncbi:hypothetical protein GGI00_000431 [Coemansia sp. RSA 2681]|nr:hypothetical protein GGI00_000431 [Coemansia sp. RSA 2681]